MEPVAKRGSLHPKLLAQWGPQVSLNAWAFFTSGLAKLKPVVSIGMLRLLVLSSLCRIEYGHGSSIQQTEVEVVFTALGNTLPEPQGCDWLFMLLFPIITSSTGNVPSIWLSWK